LLLLGVPSRLWPMLAVLWAPVAAGELELLVLFPGGFAWEVHFDVDVR
jgi:hypothetical protein